MGKCWYSGMRSKAKEMDDKASLKMTRLRWIWFAYTTDSRSPSQKNLIWLIEAEAVCAVMGNNGRNPRETTNWEIDWRPPFTRWTTCYFTENMTACWICQFSSALYEIVSRIFLLASMGVRMGGEKMGIWPLEIVSKNQKCLESLKSEV